MPIYVNAQRNVHQEPGRNQLAGMTNPDAGTLPQPAAPRFLAVIRDYHSRNKVCAAVENYGGKVTEWFFGRGTPERQRDPLDQLPAPHLFDAIVLASPVAYSRQLGETHRLMDWATRHGKAMVVLDEEPHSALNNPQVSTLVGMVILLAEVEERRTEQERRLLVRRARGQRIRVV